MKYSNIICGEFISRPNRFCAIVNIDGTQILCHVKNTGRCKEILVPGCKVYLEESSNPNRKTKYDVVALKKGGRLINIDSFAPNVAVGEWLTGGGLFKNPSLVKSECSFKNSRFDFFVKAENKEIFIEVKGVTLENNGVVMFPDAPTQRGVKHLKELMECVKDGYEAYIIFVVQMTDVKYFTPNGETHREFADVLRQCQKNGVNILCFDCEVTPQTMKIGKQVEVRL